MSLRFLLLIIGVCLVVGIYLWEVLSRKMSDKRHSKVLFNHDSPTGQGIPSVKNELEYDSESTEDAMLTRPRGNDGNDVDEDIRKISISAKRGKGPVLDKEQIPLILHDVIESDDKPVDVLNTKDSNDTHAGKSITEDELLMLVIAPENQDFFNGLDILSATKSAGMKFGKMNIFHNYGVGDLKLEVPLFSLANLYEPGEFNLQEMETFSTRGLIIYMCLPAPVESEIALELMLNTAQRIADILGGRICDRLRKPLTDNELENMRDKLKRFQKQ